MKGRFIKVEHSDGTQDFENSYWEVWMNEDVLLLECSVKDFCQQDPTLTYNDIATKEFGNYLLKRVKRKKAFW